MTFEEWWNAFKFRMGIFTPDPGYSELVESYRAAFEAGREFEKESYAKRANAEREDLSNDYDGADEV